MVDVLRHVIRHERSPNRSAQSTKFLTKLYGNYSHVHLWYCNTYMWLVLILITTSIISITREESQEEKFDDSVKCTPHDPIECTGRNPVCLFSKQTKDYRCCSDVPQDLSNPPGVPEHVKPICPYGASSYDIPSVLLCDPSETNPCPEEYTCEQVILHEFAQTTGSTPPEIRTGDHFSMLPHRFRKPVYLRKVILLHDQMRHEFHHVLVLYNPHGNPEAMNFYYNRPSTLSREIDLTVPAWDEGIFFRNMNRVLTVQSDQISTKQTRKLYIVLVFQTKVRLTRRNAQTWHDFHANYTSFTDFLTSETGKFLGTPVAGTYFYITS
ncbi:hypothetical protein RB195_026208 [Necator americanus]|uniref:Uncharacterized protein n=1 Tax=Necator americanus TaxID=51031 RepID=A0ABR1EVX0_NECAM